MPSKKKKIHISVVLQHNTLSRFPSQFAIKNNVFFQVFFEFLKEVIGAKGEVENVFIFYASYNCHTKGNFSEKKYEVLFHIKSFSSYICSVTILWKKYLFWDKAFTFSSQICRLHGFCSSLRSLGNQVPSPYSILDHHAEF